MEHENDDDTNCNWSAQYSQQRTGGFGNKRTMGELPNFSIVEVGKNIKKSLGDLRRLSVTQTINYAGMKFW